MEGRRINKRCERMKKEIVSIRRIRRGLGKRVRKNMGKKSKKKGKLCKLGEGKQQERI